MIKRLTAYTTSFWQQWLLHAFLIWSGLNLIDIFLYLNKRYMMPSDFASAHGAHVVLWQRFINHNINQAMGVFILFITLLTEANYHFVFRKRPLLYFAGSTCLAATFSFLFVVFFNRWNLDLQRSIVFDIQPISFIALYIVGYALFRNFIYIRIAEKEKKYEFSRAQLRTLQAGLHPHFFFNTLNNLYGTALQEKAERTAQSIEQLSAMMRYVMKKSREDFTSVAEEINFLQDYLELQQIRIPQRESICIQTQISYDNKPARIAPLLLMPFIENAFRYGISIDLNCFIHLRLVIANARLEMELENKKLPISSVENGTGTGIRDVSKRLELLYPNRHKLKISSESGIYKVWLQLELD